MDCLGTESLSDKNLTSSSFASPSLAAAAILIRSAPLQRFTPTTSDFEAPGDASIVRTHPDSCTLAKLFEVTCRAS